MSRFAVGAVVGLVMLACAVPAGAATSVQWESGFGNGRYVALSVDAAAGETNDLEIFAEARVAGQPQSVIVRDRGAGVTTISASVTPGDCRLPADGRCEVPCQIVTPTEARCRLADGFSYKEPVDEQLLYDETVPSGPLNPGSAGYVPNPDGFTHIDIRPGDGADRLRVPPRAGIVEPSVSTADGGDTYELGSEIDFSARDGDRVHLSSATPLLSGISVEVAGDAEVFGVNDRSDHVRCFGDRVDHAKIHVDQYDGVDCGSWQQDGVLPSRPIDLG